MPRARKWVDGPRWSDQGHPGANEGRGAVSHPAATWHGAGHRVTDGPKVDQGKGLRPQP